MAFLSSMIAKESMLGVMGALFGGTTDVVTIAFIAYHVGLLIWK